MNRISKRSGVALLLCVLFLLGFGAFVFEFLANGEKWALFPGSPHVYNGGNIGCGTICDREGTTLLKLSDGRIYHEDPLVRQATVHWLGDRKGSVSAPALSHYASQIVSYDRLNGVYVYGSHGSTAHMTLSAQMQKAALTALGDARGAVAVMNYKTGEILCAVSTPTFDPDAPTIEVESMYLNRFIQGLYTPGSIFKTVTLAAALEENPELTKMLFTCTGAIPYGTNQVTCQTIHGTQTVQEAFANSCNCAFANLADMLGKEKLTAYAEKFGVAVSVKFDGITTAKGKFDLSDAAPISVAWSAVGQYTNLINPCAFLQFMAAVANDGVGVAPYVVSQIREGYDTHYEAKTVYGERILSAETAALLKSYLRYNVKTKYGEDNFSGFSVGAKTGTAEVGEGKNPNAMLSGFVADEGYPLAFIICVEEGDTGRKTCVPIAEKVLASVKDALG